MIVYPNAKINLGLNVHSKLENGYHLLQSFFLPIPLRDILEIVEDEGFGKVTFSKSGIPISGGVNLCEQAYNILNNRHNLPSVKIHLHKIIPIGAGLGGGSADASFTLNLLNDMFQLGHSKTELEGFAKELGADCPFFIENSSKYVEGIGEIMTPIDTTALKGKILVMVFPQIHVSTQEAYSGIRLGKKQDYSRFSFSQFSNYKTFLNNDFESHIFETHPILKSIKKDLYKHGAFYAAMSGSGSTMFGLFDSDIELEEIQGFDILKLNL